MLCVCKDVVLWRLSSFCQSTRTSCMVNTKQHIPPDWSWTIADKVCLDLQVIANSLQNILDYEGDVENTFLCSFAISYTDVFGSVLTHELMENGKDIPVTNENRKVIYDYLTQFCWSIFWLFPTSVEESNFFYKILPEKLWR